MLSFHRGSPCGLTADVRNGRAPDAANDCGRYVVFECDASDAPSDGSVARFDRRNGRVEEEGSNFIVTATGIALRLLASEGYSMRMSALTLQARRA